MTTNTLTTDSNYESSFSNPRLWIRNPFYDLSLVTGGALFTLFLAATVFRFPMLLPFFFWIWVIAFEGSHFWATFSRTYFDTQFRKQNGRVLYGSLVWFIFPALAILLEQSGNGVKFALLYGFFIFVWSLFHNARQHFGFMSIYAGKSEVSATIKSKLTLSLYMAVCFAQAHFLLNFKIQGVFGLSSAAALDPTLSFVVGELPIYLSAIAFVYWIKTAIETVQEVGQKAFMPIFYIGICMIFYCTMFYVIAPRDLFIQNLSGVQTLMLIAIMNSLFHNIQYHAIVYHYGQKRYPTQSAHFGWAKAINRNFLSYLGIALSLGLVFAFIVWNVGDWPNFFGEWTQPKTQTWAYVLFFGIIGHHFYLDQKIWRPSKSTELRDYLKNA